MDEPPDSTDLFIRKARQGFFGRLFSRSRVSPVDGGGNDPVGMLEQRLKDGRLLSFWRRRKKPILIVTSATLLGAFLWKGGPTSIERATKSAADCSNSNYQGLPGASLDCAGRARFWLYPAKIIPWTRKEAIAKELSIRSDEIVTRTKLAAMVTLDADVLRAAPEELLKVVRDPSYPPDLRKDDWVFDVTSIGGDATASLSVADLAKGGTSRLGALSTAMSIGDLGRAKELAANDEADVNAYDYHLARGAFLCLTGDREKGIHALDEATTDYQAGVHSQFTRASVAKIMCGGDATVEGENPYREGIWLANILAHPAPETAFSHLDPKAPFETEARESPQPMLAVWLAKSDPTPREVITVVAKVKIYFDRSLTPWVSGRLTVPGLFDTSPMPVDPAPLEITADKLSKLADDFERGAIKPFAPKELENEYDDTVRSALDKPVPVLRDAASGLRLLAASACAASFNLTCESHALEKLPADYNKAAALFLASDFARGGDRAKAREHLADALAAHDATAHFYALLSDAMLDLGEGKKTEGHQAALEAAKLIPAINAQAGQLASITGPEIEHAAGWVLTATALQSGAADIPVSVPAPTYFENDTLPKDWLTLTRASDPVRREARWRMLNIDFGVGATQVLPAVIYVLREFARDGKDPDLWVNHALGTWDADYLGPTALRARAEAARWGDNAAGAKIFDDRAAKLEALFTDPEHSLLARLAKIQ